MFGITLSTLSLVLGVFLIGVNLWGLAKPAALVAAARKFPRHIPTGVILVLLGTVWFIINVSQESLSDFTRMKTGFYVLFAGVGIATCIFVHDFLAVRGLALVMLLLAKLMVDTARWADTSWRLVIVIWAYAMVLAGMWWTVSPWRVRDLIEWACASERRVRTTSTIRLAFGVLLVILALTVYRGAPSPRASAVVPWQDLVGLSAG
jgi:hypothetical protein